MLSWLQRLLGWQCCSSNRLRGWGGGDGTVISCSRFLFLSISQTTEFLAMMELMSKLWQHQFKQPFLHNVAFWRRKPPDILPPEENRVFFKKKKMFFLFLFQWLYSSLMAPSQWATVSGCITIRTVVVKGRCNVLLLTPSHEAGTSGGSTMIKQAQVQVCLFIFIYLYFYISISG